MEHLGAGNATGRPAPTVSASGANAAAAVNKADPIMSGVPDPIVQFHQLFRGGRAPIRADRSACGTLPMRAVRYCEALTSATAFGWWLFPPVDLELLWDGTEIFWRSEADTSWLGLSPSAHLPGYADAFDVMAPEAVRGYAPPFLTALPEPGTLQLWTGLIAQTVADWHLLVRSPANLPQVAGICLFEGIIESDRWFGPLFTTLRFTRSHHPVRLRCDYPLVQIQPVPRYSYSDDTLGSMEVTAEAAGLSEEQWSAYYASIVEPHCRPDRPFGAYAAAARRARRQCPMRA